MDLIRFGGEKPPAGKLRCNVSATSLKMDFNVDDILL
jgi:hypothetical protein